jgi:protein-disulfide isomerase
MFQSSVQQAREQFADRVALVFIHYPLKQHRFALPAARVLECATEQGAAEAMLDFMYANQDSLGLQGWAWFAEGAHVTDSDRFTRCLSGPIKSSRIEEGIKLGNRIGVRGTPTVLINGWRFSSHPYPASNLIDAIKRILDGGAPVDVYRTRRF